MSSRSKDDEVKLEKQRLLAVINEDLQKLKLEVKYLNDLVKDNAALPNAVRLVNDQLMAAAEAAGIKLDGLRNFEDVEDSDIVDGSQRNESQPLNRSLSSIPSSAGALATATAAAQATLDELSKIQEGPLEE